MPRLRKFLALRLQVLAVFALAGAGCAHRSQFTTAEELRQVAQQTRPAKAFAAAAIDVPRYALEGPFNATAHEGTSPWGALLLASAKGRFEPDGALACAAKELSRFSLEHQGSPSDSLESFVLARCGSTTAHAASQTLSGEAADDLPEAALFTQWEQSVREMIAKIVPGEHAGIALTRAKGRAWLTMLRHQRLAVLKAAPRVGDFEGKLVVEGQLTYPVEKVDALINQGPLGWAECVRDEGAVLPTFRFVCVARKEDAQAWLSIGAWEKDRVLGKEVARVLVWPAGEPINLYTAPAYATPGPPTPEAFVERVNAVRTTAGLPPLKLAAQQSSTAASVAPYFFGETDAHDSDKIALGLMAGWEVEGLVSTGSFNAEWTPQPDSGALLSSMLEQPSGRRSLMDPTASRIAAGLVAEGNTVGALISTYAIMEEVVDPVEAPKQLIAQLNEARAKLGKGPAEWIANPNDFYTRAAKSLLANEVTPTQAANQFMDETVRFTNRPVSGLTQTVTTLDKVQWAEEVLAHPSPQVLIFVGVQKARGDAWGRYVVLVLLLEGAPGGPQA
jgi:hypothetical protein